MAEVVVVIDSSANIPPPLADEQGILVAPVGIDCRDGHFLDGQLSRQHYNRGLRESGSCRV
jgi:fatty acid-binding protein DegV